MECLLHYKCGVENYTQVTDVGINFMYFLLLIGYPLDLRIARYW
jgi:hypothetical protein